MSAREGSVVTQHIGEAPEGADAAIASPAAPEAKSKRQAQHMAFLALFALALVMPAFTKNFVMFQLTLTMVYAIAIVGLNLLTGFNGQFSLGHSAFFAVGAYTAAMLMEHAEMSYVWTLPIAGVICFVFGFMLGLSALKLADVYSALATFALAAATPQILKLSPLQRWTGGVQGIVIAKPDAPFGLPLNQDQWVYYFTLIVGTILYIAARNLVMSRSGRALLAIRDNPIAARSMGINISLYRAGAFGLSALYTGVAGALGAISVQFVAPDSFTLTLSIGLLVGLVVGGVGWLPGALFGGAFLLFVPNIAEHISKGLSGAVYGLLLIAVIYVMPSGVAGVFRAIICRFTQHRLTKSVRAAIKSARRPHQ